MAAKVPKAANSPSSCFSLRVGRGVCRGESPVLSGQELCKCSLSMCTMSTRMQETPESEELACMLCGQIDVDPSICGPKHVDFGICVHAFCAMFSTSLLQKGRILNRIVVLRPEDIRYTIQQAEQKHCFICGKRGASITCAETGCERSFHLPCTVEGECVSQHFEKYSSFCQEHSPQQAVEATPEQDTTCIICMDPVGDKKSYSTMVCPACKHAWFHRACIQGQATCTGIKCFQCPHCRNKDKFKSEMFIMGIQIPDRRPVWEDNDAYALLGNRHRRCDVSECLYQRGREQAEEEGPWQLLLCSSCAAEGTHRQCSYLSNLTDSWECNTCASVSNASGANLDLTDDSTASEQGLGPLYGSMAPESSTSSQAALGPAHSFRVPESSSQSRQTRMEQRTIQSHLHQDKDVYNQLHGCHGDSHAAALGNTAERWTLISASHRASGSSRDSPEAGSHRSRQGGCVRTRSRSPLQSQAPDSQS
ncbi:PHD finger protein 7-like [Meleagris gallopavo]|uniref:PHD finger protein 7-like n=1 Tax=Meleagris gallopavo TaxID=9103 RepID=UPI0012ABB497|nr:PHD finger protein 7-like [Meleagris gallopavo]